MSVVTGQTRRRWAAVAAAVAVLACVPAVTALAAAATGRISGGAAPSMPPRQLLARALASADVPHQGLAESRGNLGLPDLPAIDDVPALLGGSARTRVWWAGPTRWRVDVLTPTGEQGTYRQGSALELWDYEENQLTRVPAESPVRLPRAADLLPPQISVRLLHGLAAGDRVASLGRARSIAGATADGLRVTPAGADSTIGHIDVWVDRAHGLPVAFTLVDRHGVTALDSRFTQLSFSTPAAGILKAPAAPDARREVDDTPDIASRIQRFAPPQTLPATLAGRKSSAPLAGAAASYGTGLVRFAVLPIPQRLAGRVVEAARDGGGVASSLPQGESVAFGNSVLSLVVVRRSSDGNGYVLAGMVDQALLSGAAGQLLERPGS